LIGFCKACFFITHTIQRQKQQEQPYQIVENDTDEGGENEHEHEGRHWNVDDN